MTARKKVHAPPGGIESNPLSLAKITMQMPNRLWRCDTIVTFTTAEWPGDGETKDAPSESREGILRGTGHRTKRRRYCEAVRRQASRRSACSAGSGTGSEASRRCV